MRFRGIEEWRNSLVALDKCVATIETEVVQLKEDIERVAVSFEDTLGEARTIILERLDGLVSSSMAPAESTRVAPQPSLAAAATLPKAWGALYLALFDLSLSSNQYPDSRTTSRLKAMAEGTLRDLAKADLAAIVAKKLATAPEGWVDEAHPLARHLGRVIFLATLKSALLLAAKQKATFNEIKEIRRGVGQLQTDARGVFKEFGRPSRAQVSALDAQAKKAEKAGRQFAHGARRFDAAFDALDAREKTLNDRLTRVDRAFQKWLAGRLKKLHADPRWEAADREQTQLEGYRQQLDAMADAERSRAEDAAQMAEARENGVAVLLDHYSRIIDEENTQLDDEKDLISDVKGRGDSLRMEQKRKTAARSQLLQQIETRLNRALGANPNDRTALDNIRELTSLEQERTDAVLAMVDEQTRILVGRLDDFLALLDQHQGGLGAQETGVSLWMRDREHERGAMRDQMENDRTQHLEAALQTIEEDLDQQFKVLDALRSQLLQEENVERQRKPLRIRREETRINRALRRVNRNRTGVLQQWQVLKNKMERLGDEMRSLLREVDDDAWNAFAERLLTESADVLPLKMPPALGKHFPRDAQQTDMARQTFDGMRTAIRKATRDAYGPGDDDS